MWTSMWFPHHKIKDYCWSMYGLKYVWPDFHLWLHLSMNKLCISLSSISFTIYKQTRICMLHTFMWEIFNTIKHFHMFTVWKVSISKVQPRQIHVSIWVSLNVMSGCNQVIFIVTCICFAWFPFLKVFFFYKSQD